MLLVEDRKSPVTKSLIHEGGTYQSLIVGAFRKNKRNSGSISVKPLKGELDYFGDKG